jgi:guanine deaminase
MRLAVDAAMRGIAAGGGPFGAAVVDASGAVLACSHNRVTLDADPTAHAEVVCIREACKKLGTFSLEGCTVYTTCEPCSMCLSAILWARAARVVYGNTREDAHEIGFDDKEFYDELAKPMHERRRLPMTQMHRELTIGTFDAWRDKGDKTQY